MPINPDNAEEFDPVDGVPTVSQLLMELDQSDLNTASADLQVSTAQAYASFEVPCRAKANRVSSTTK